jgi:hypothetical protein
VKKKLVIRRKIIQNMCLDKGYDFQEMNMKQSKERYVSLHIIDIRRKKQEEDKKE